MIRRRAWRRRRTPLNGSPSSKRNGQIQATITHGGGRCCCPMPCTSYIEAPSPLKDRKTSRRGVFPNSPALHFRSQPPLPSTRRCRPPSSSCCSAVTSPSSSFPSASFPCWQPPLCASALGAPRASSTTGEDAELGMCGVGCYCCRRRCKPPHPSSTLPSFQPFQTLRLRRGRRQQQP